MQSLRQKIGGFFNGPWWPSGIVARVFVTVVGAPLLWYAGIWLLGIAVYLVVMAYGMLLIWGPLVLCLCTLKKEWPLTKKVVVGIFMYGLGLLLAFWILRVTGDSAGAFSDWVSDLLQMLTKAPIALLIRLIRG